MDSLRDRVTDFFDSDSSEYLRHKYGKDADSYMALRRERVESLLTKHLAPSFGDGFRLIDCGCGPGILLDVVGKYRINYCGVDISEGMLKLARTQPPGTASNLLRKDVLRSDVESLPFKSASFDAATSLGVIEYLSDDDRLIAEMARVVKPGGYVLIAVTNKYSYNMALDKPMSWLRSNAAAVKGLNLLKRALNLGTFRQATFTKRRHSTRHFTRRLQAHGLTVVETDRWGLNFLPHPLQYLCGGFLNRLANRMYNRTRSQMIRSLGEGYLVLCRRDGLS